MKKANFNTQSFRDVEDLINANFENFECNSLSNNTPSNKAIHSPLKVVVEKKVMFHSDSKTNVINDCLESPQKVNNISKIDKGNYTINDESISCTSRQTNKIKKFVMINRSRKELNFALKYMEVNKINIPELVLFIKGLSEDNLTTKD